MPETEYERRPPVAAPLQAGLREIAEALPAELRTASDMRAYRDIAAARGTTGDAVAAKLGLEQRTIGPHVTAFRAPGADPRLRVLFLHGGGLIAGNRFDGVDVIARFATELALDVWTADYPLVPDARHDAILSHLLPIVRAAVEDGLPLVIAGQSAGGGLAASLALLSREHGIPLAGHLLVCPMLDARNTVSAAQFDDDPSWTRTSNRSCWAAALEGSGSVAPGRRDDLHDLAPTFLDVGSAEVFRDSVVRFAGSLWEAGNSTELHVWSGGFHASDCVVEDAVVSQQAHHARREWLRRLIDGGL